MVVQSNVDSAFNLQHSNFKFSPRQERRNLLACLFEKELRNESQDTFTPPPHFIRVHFDFCLVYFALIQQ